MNRRRFLESALGVSSVYVLTGCSELTGSSDTPTPRVQPTRPEKRNPSITWSEEWIEGRNYRLKVSVNLDDLERLTIQKISGTELAVVSSNGEHVVAGPDTDYGPVKGGAMLRAKAPDPLRVEGDLQPFMVGSQDRPKPKLYLRGLHGDTAPSKNSGEILERQFTHDSNQGKIFFMLKMPKSIYSYYKNRPRLDDYGAYVSAGFDDKYLKTIANELTSVADQELNDTETINLAMDFVQNLEYSKDKVSTGFNEYPKFPAETLVDKGGDCEDTCILLSSLLNQLGYDTTLLLFRQKQHMALGVAREGLPGTYFEKNGKKYYYVETTSPGWRVGQIPENIRGARAQLSPVDSHPMLVFSYAVDTPDARVVKVKIAVANYGDAPTDSAKVRVQFQDKEKNTVAAKTTDSLQVKPGKGVDTSVRMNPTAGQPLRAKLTLLLNGQYHDSLTSEYRDPIKIGTTTSSG